MPVTQTQHTLTSTIPSHVHGPQAQHWLPLPLQQYHHQICWRAEITTQQRQRSSVWTSGWRRKVTQPLLINGDCVERVSDLCFLGAHITEEFTWGVNIAYLMRKAQQRLYLPKVIRKNNTPQKLLKSFNHSLLTYCLCVWFYSCTVTGVNYGWMTVLDIFFYFIFTMLYLCFCCIYVFI